MMHAARTPSSMVVNCSNTESVPGVILPNHFWLDLMMLRGLQLRIPLGVVGAIEFVINT